MSVYNTICQSHIQIPKFYIAWWAPLTTEPPAWRVHPTGHTCTHDTFLCLQAPGEFQRLEVPRTEGLGHSIGPWEICLCLGICPGRLWPPPSVSQPAGSEGGHHFCCSRRPFLCCSQNTKWLTLHPLCLPWQCVLPYHSLTVCPVCWAPGHFHSPRGCLGTKGGGGWGKEHYWLCPSLLSNSHEGCWILEVPSAVSMHETAGHDLPLHCRMHLLRS